MFNEAYSFAKDFLAGGISGIISKTATAPIERVKLLLQTQHANNSISVESRYKGPIDCLTRVVKEQGVLSLWRGNMANVLRYFPNQAINFAFKDKFKTFFLKNICKEDFWWFILGNLASGGSAGATALVMTHPLDIVRTRMAADVSSVYAERQFKGIFSCLKTIFIQNGMKGLYKGFAVSFLGAAVFKALHLGGYDILKSLAHLDQHSSMWKKYSLAQVLTLIAGTLCYPFDTIKRRVMMQAEYNLPANPHPTVLVSDTEFGDMNHVKRLTSIKRRSGSYAHIPHYTSASNCFYRIVVDEGWTALFRGLSVNIVRGISGAILLVGYDEVKVLFKDL